MALESKTDSAMLFLQDLLAYVNLSFRSMPRHTDLDIIFDSAASSEPGGLPAGETTHGDVVPIVTLLESLAM